MAVLLPGFLVAEPFRYHEDFETKDPAQFWTSNGPYEVHFKGLTDEEAHSGRRCFKLDVTLGNGTYWYWKVPVLVPASGRLRFSAWIKVVTLSPGAGVGLGANYAFRPTNHSGCGAFDTLRAPSRQWVRIQGDLAAEGARRADAVVKRYVYGATVQNVTVWVDRWGVFVFGRSGQRVTLLVDDVTMEGDVPDPGQYAQKSEKRFAPVRQKLSRELAEQERVLQRATAKLAEYRNQAKLPPTAERLAEYASQTAQAARQLLQRLRRGGFGSPAEVAELKQRVELLEHVVPNLQRLVAGGLNRPLVVFVSRPITNARILPNSFPIPGHVSDRLQVTACPGEYEPATFTVLAVDELRGLEVQVDALRSDDGQLPPECVDVRVVKCWFQGKGNIGRSVERVLKPELLLKDDSLVRVDLEKKRNYVRTTDSSGRTVYVDVSRDLLEGATADDLKDLRPRDAERLQPVDVAKEQAKQFWVTVHVPEDATPGTYRGRVRLRAGGRELARLELSVRVLPFRLEPPPLLYGLYYTGRLSRDGRPSISSKWKSEEQMRVELQDMKAHGVLYPTSYEVYDERWLRRTLELRREVGLPTGPFVSLGIGTGNDTDPKKLAAKQAEVRRWLKLVRRRSNGTRTRLVFQPEGPVPQPVRSTRRRSGTVSRRRSHCLLASHGRPASLPAGQVPGAGLRRGRVRGGQRQR